jgi:hypothetical protein
MRELPERTDRFGKLFAALSLLAIFGAMSLPAFAAPKTDVIVFKNGDKLTGELRFLKRGRLSFNTDATGTISIEWARIDHIESLQNIQVETNTGTRFFGHLMAAEKSGRVVVATDSGPQMLDGARVILMSPIEKKGIGAFDIDLTVGYNFAKAGGVKQGSFGIAVDYRTRLRIYSVSASTVTNDSSEQESSKRANFGLQYKRLWNNRWYVNGNLTLDKNDELGLDLRTTLGGGGGRFHLQSNSMILGLEAGLQVSREDLQADPVTGVDPEDVDSVEATFSLDWDWFRFDAPELDWSTSLEIIPSLTQSGRVRAEFDTGLRWEMFDDLKWGIDFYSSFDNQPQTENASTSDYGVNTTLTYEF